MAKFLKENWFVGIIAVFFIAISIYFAYDQNKDNLPGKKVNGKQIVFQVDDKNFSADDVYDDLYKTYSSDKLFITFFKTLCDEKVKTTDELKTKVENQVQSTISYYQNYYGYGEDYLNYMAQYYGYNDFRDYVFYNLKGQDVYSEYIKANMDTLVTDEFINENKPRIISYCLIKMDDPANPTADETARLQAAQEAWANWNQDFAEFAKKYSEDSSTASDGGKLGYVDKNSSLVEAFLSAALQLQSGEISDWVFDENYGYFLIKCDSTNVDDFKDSDDFLNGILNSKEDFQAEIIWNVAQQSGFKASEEITEKIKEYLGISEESEG